MLPTSRRNLPRILAAAMPEIIAFIMLFGGFVYLLLGGELLVLGALSLSRESNIPRVVIGMTVVAMGTSAPELMVSILSAMSGHPGITIGNIVGSNIANVMLVLGIPVLIYPIACTQQELPRQTHLMIGVSLLFIVMCVYSPISFLEGLLLIFILLCFLALVFRGVVVISGLDDVEKEQQHGVGQPRGPGTITLFILLGALTLPLGAYLVVESGVALATSWGVTEAVIGLSLIALGTSLPELSTLVIAALHKSPDVAIGNVIGSNLFNILAILGITALLTDIPVDPEFIKLDLWVMFASSIVLWLFVLTKATIGRIAGGLLLSGYIFYIYSIY